jgi:hypothetical protein
MFTSRKKYTAALAALDEERACNEIWAEMYAHMVTSRQAAELERDDYSEQANVLYEEATLLREYNTQWRDLYEFMQERETELYAEIDRLRSENYQLMGYALEDDDADVPF